MDYKINISVCCGCAVNEDTVDTLNKLIPQLSQSALPVTIEELQRIADHDACTLLLAYLGGEIVGCTTLVTFPLPSGVRAWIEDVVVDESARGCGVGEQLTKEAIRVAKVFGAKTIDLTSRPSREAANRLYERAGFVLRETNLYRYDV